MRLLITGEDLAYAIAMALLLGAVTVSVMAILSIVTSVQPKLPLM